MSSHIDKLHESASDKARRWSFSEEFLDTEDLRGISYGNLFLRKQSHLYLGHGVIVAFLCLGCFWLVSANWDRLTAWTGLFGHAEDESPQCYTVVTSVTQLPPPPPIARPEPPKAPPAAAPPAVKAPANVGKIRKVKKEEAPPEQTLATQKEIRQAIRQQVGNVGSADGAGLDVPMFVPCETMPAVLKQKKPRYPEIARQAGIEGKVFVSVLIGETGKALRVKIMKRVPADQTVFDDVAIESVMASTYSPGIQNGSPVKVWLTVPIRFELN
ncbi:energy transducer TonB [Prosthecochloris sp. GSB1]|uniref:energy transducer TonB n=1 Tax=Prosthecochloris sp. GSB1 TaxID=281093 RepID=UPI000B8CC65F|nr:energy transducer TonB [Prosthecochloris sp. GSB1]ASQ90987.1 energy transducer TonB [Prosthecochloris sp. GSB1]